MTEPGTARDNADMRRLAGGDDAALNDLMARHAARLHAFLRRLLQNDWDAEDLAQETFVRVYEHRRRFDPRLSFTTWLYAIASNLVRDRYRWRSRHPEAPLERPAGPNPDPDPESSREVLPPHVPRDASNDPASRTLAAERAEAVRLAVASLPEDLRLPLVLAEFEDRPQKEIGTILGCSAKAVEMRLYRARQRLREQLSPWLQDEGHADPFERKPTSSL